MSNSIQDSILASIDTMVNNRIDKIQADKTITAQVVSCTNALEGEYRLSYQGGFITAYAQEGQSFRQNTTVYVLVPMGDFTKRKHIISKAQALENDNNISFVASAMSNYNLIGSNVIKPYKKAPKDYWSFTSYIKDNYVALYDRDMSATESEKNGMCYIDGDALSNYIRDAEALLIEASFQTNLPREHRLTKTGRYGVSFNLAFADKAQGWNDDGTPVAINYYSYVIDTDNMTGNPFQYQRWNDQYMIFPIDTENFLYVQSIMFFGNDFVEKDDIAQATLNPENVWVKDLEIYGLREISAVNGDYKLSLSTPAGATLHSTKSDEKVRAVAKLTNKETNLSEATMFYWFKEDGRITPDSEDYQMYGGVGWRRLKDKGCSYSMETSGFENRAYENKYLCVAVYQETMVLKTYFTIYNDSCKWDISITSSLGEKFSFDRGIPELTCLINGRTEDFDTKPADDPQHKPDKLFAFYWSKIDESGQVFTFNQTLEEVDAEIDRIMNDPSIEQKAGPLLALKEKQNQLADAVFELGKNKLSYPVRNIKGNARFRCSVYLKDNSASEDWYGIGSAEILLQNADAAIPTDYYIVIEGGDQVFQYSESGVAPDSERYTEEDRLKIKPLTIHFYDPAGLEVSPKTYSWKFIVPTSDTMIQPPATLSMNPANNKIEVYVGDTYPTAIKSSYDFQALNNQIKAIVTYEGQEYSQLTTFLFAKVGENGTNGTDLVAKIDPISPPQDCLLAMELDKDGNATGYNNGKTKDDKILEYKLFARNEPVTLDTSRIYWKINGYSGQRNGVLDCSGDGSQAKVSLVSPSGNNKVYQYEQLIVQANTTYNNNAMYANFGMPIVQYKKSGYKLKLDKDYTLRSVLYNADGRNPLYNKNQGIFIKVLYNGQDITDAVSTIYRATGGENGTNPSFGLSYDKNPKKEDIKVSLPSAHSIVIDKVDSAGKPVLDENGKPITEQKTVNADHIYITPEDVFSGAFTNNNVKISISHAGQDVIEARVPIFMSLNTYGLKSLNAWDGNTLQINEEENYILAPQIGAGEKDNQNRFTGVVMGVAEYYDQAENKTSKQNGLLGYSCGKESIFLNAQDGSATFGLPESGYPSDGNTENRVEGRIQLIPGGISEIGSWKIGSKSFFNINNLIDTGSANDRFFQTTQPYGKRQLKTSALAPYSDLDRSVYANSISVPHDLSGVLINADPAYISLKGKLLTDNDDINYDAANTVIQKGDSFEVQLNPLDSSIFSLYRHTNSPKDGVVVKAITDSSNVTRIQDASSTTYSTLQGNDSSGNPIWKLNKAADGSVFYVGTRRDGNKWVIHRVKGTGVAVNANFTASEQNVLDHADWRRDLKVGINNQGRFFTNALKDNTTALNIGNIGAFGYQATDNMFTGASFEVGDDRHSNTLIKFFTDTSGINGTTGNLYISGGTNTDADYARSLNFYGSSINLYTNSARTSSTITNPNQDSVYRFKLSPSSTEIGHFNSDGTGSRLFLNNSTSDSSILCSYSNLEIKTANTNRSAVMTFGPTTMNTTTYTENSTGARNTTVRGAYTTNIYNNNYTINGYYNTSNASTSGLTLGSGSAVLEAKDLGNGGAKLQLRNGTNSSSIVTNSSFDLNTKNGGITVHSDNSADGIKIYARRGSAANTEARISLIPGQDSNNTPSTFTITTTWASLGCGSITSNNSNYRVASIGPGFISGYGQLNSTIPGTTDPTLALDCTAGSVRAAGFFWRSGYYYTKDGNNQSTAAYLGVGSNSVWVTFNRVCELITNDRGRITDNTNKYNTLNGTVSSNYTNLSNRINDLRGYVNDNFSKIGHTHSQYITESTANNRYAKKPSSLTYSYFGATTGLDAATRFLLDAVAEIKTKFNAMI